MILDWRMGKGLAMFALIVSTAWLEVKGKDTGGLWLLVFLWITLGSWD